MNEDQYALMNSTTVNSGRSEWVNFNWKAIQHRVKFLRYRIFSATRKKDSSNTIRLQGLMLNSSANILLAIRQVTSNNRYKSFSGIEKIRIHLVQELMNINLSSYSPIVYKSLNIPKTSRKQKLLKIEILKDLCIQLIVKNALEPEWEARFEENTYGSRPGRCSHDAIAHSVQIMRTDSARQWVTSMHLEQTLSNLNVELILRKLHSFPRVDLIFKWLKAGCINLNNHFQLDLGAAVDSVVGSLLLDITFDDFDKIIKNHYSSATTRHFYVRHTNNILIFSQTKEEAMSSRSLFALWCENMGINCTLDSVQISHLKDGFNFLGIQVCPKKYSNYSIALVPNQDAQKEIRAKLKSIWMRGRGKDVQWVLEKLNPRIREWCSYYSFYKSSKIFKDIDNWMFQRSVRYCKRTHPNKSWTWMQKKYFGRFNAKKNSRWIFGDKETGKYLIRFSWTTIRQYTPIQIQASPDNVIYESYWIKRNATGITNNQLWNISDFKIAQRQNNICPICEGSLYNQEPIEKHRIIIKKSATQIYPFNMMFLHSMCYECLKNTY